MSTIKFNPADRTEPGCEGRLRLMARSGGFVMARYSRLRPFVLSEKEWGKLALFSPPSDTSCAEKPGVGE